MTKKERGFPLINQPLKENSDLGVVNPHFLLFLVSLIWGFNFSVIKAGIMAFGPLSFTFIRFVLSSFFMGFVLWRREDNFWIEKKDLPYFIWLPLLGFGIYQPLWSWGLKLTLASHSAVILSLSPLVVYLVVFFYREEKVGAKNLLGVGLGFLGVLLLARPGDTSHAGDIFWGDLLTLGAAICWGLYGYFSKKMLQKYSPLKTSTWSVFLGVFFLFPVCYFELTTVQWSHFNGLVIFSLLYGSILASLVAYILWLNGVQKIGASRTSAYQYLIQVIGVVAAWIIYQDPVGWNLLSGMALISLGLWLTQAKA